MSRSVASPLLDVAMSYVTEAAGDLKPYDTALIRAAFDGYINRGAGRAEVSSLLLQHLENTAPLDHLDEILASADEPIPEVPELPSNVGEDGNKIRRKTRSWNTHEDHRLLYAVHLYGLENWTQVAQFVGGGRTRSMCSQRWIRVLDPRISKTQWTADEEQKLVKLVSIYGEKSWMRVATELGNRSDVQCRYRYMQLQKGLPAQKADAPAFQKEQITPVASMPEVPREDRGVKFELPVQPITAHEMQLRLDEPFGLTSSFDFFGSDPLFDSAFLF